MIRNTLLSAGLVFAASVGAAHAADSTLLAENGGFLLGNAHRCGVPAERVVRAGTVVRDLISAASSDTKEAEDADARFAEIFLASAHPDAASGLVPACKTVLNQFNKLEQHHQQARAN